VPHVPQLHMGSLAHSLGNQFPQRVPEKQYLPPSLHELNCPARTPPAMRTIVLLTISNIFMTFAWYGHLKYRNEALWKVILASWGIAFFEYCFQVPANRIGSYEFTSAQLKTIQEIITLVVFSVFSVWYLGDKFKWNYAAGFSLVAAGSFFIFHKW
jgi:uncharacterized protein